MNTELGGDVRSAETLGCRRKDVSSINLSVLSEQSRKDDLPAVELGWDTHVPKLLLQYTMRDLG